MSMDFRKSPEKSGLFFSTMCRYLTISLLLHLIAAWFLIPNFTGIIETTNLQPLRLEVTIRSSVNRQSFGSVTKSVTDNGTKKSSTSPTKPSHPGPNLGITSGLLPIAQFHERNELTRQPHVVENVDLSPLQKYFSQSTEPLRLELNVDASGVIVHVAPVAPTNFSEAVAHATTLLSNIRFTPGEINGHPVGTRIIIEVLLAPVSNTTSPQTAN